jgi:hypothetical protein
MRTTRIPIQKPFVEGGLNPYPGVANTNFFYSCKNASITKESAMSGYIPEIRDILAGCSFVDSVTAAPIVITSRWPFPQLFVTDVGIHIGALEGLYYIQDTLTFSGYDPSTSWSSQTDKWEDFLANWFNDVVAYDYGTGPVTWPWSCAIIDQRPMFTSGDVMVYFDSNSQTYKVVT